MIEITETNIAVDKLKPHPANATFPDLPPEEFDALVEDMRVNGLQHALHVLPNGTILSGHQRRTAAQRLGWEEVRCRVRKDLADPLKQMEFLLQDNLHRRQLTTLQVVLVLSTHSSVLLNLDPDDAELQSRLRTLVQQRMDCSEKTARRWVGVASTPQAIQDAVERGELQLVTAHKVSLLPPKVQARIASRVEAGEDLKKVVAEATAKRRPRVTPTATSIEFSAAITRFKKVVDDAVGVTHDHAANLVQQLLPLAQRLADLISKLESETVAAVALPGPKATAATKFNAPASAAKRPKPRPTGSPAAAQPPATPRKARIPYPGA